MLVKTKKNEKCISCGDYYDPPEVTELFHRIEPYACETCVLDRRDTDELDVPLVNNWSTGTIHAVSPEPFNVQGIKTACGRVLESVPRDGSIEDVGCSVCIRVLESHPEFDSK